MRARSAVRSFRLSVLKWDNLSHFKFTLLPLRHRIRRVQRPCTPARGYRSLPCACALDDFLALLRLHLRQRRKLRALVQTSALHLLEVVAQGFGDGYLAVDVLLGLACEFGGAGCEVFLLLRRLSLATRICLMLGGITSSTQLPLLPLRHRIRRVQRLPYLLAPSDVLHTLTRASQTAGKTKPGAWPGFVQGLRTSGCQPRAASQAARCGWWPLPHAGRTSAHRKKTQARTSSRLSGSAASGGGGWPASHASTMVSRVSTRRREVLRMDAMLKLPTGDQQAGQAQRQGAGRVTNSETKTLHRARLWSPGVAWVDRIDPE